MNLLELVWRFWLYTQARQVVRMDLKLPYTIDIFYIIIYILHLSLGDICVTVTDKKNSYCYVFMYLYLKINGTIMTYKYIKYRFLFALKRSLCDFNNYL